MAQKSGFFNALLNAGIYDRTYNADDYSDNLAVVISNGVLRSINNDLYVAAEGLNLSVFAGRAWINGKYFYNDSEYSLPAITPPTGGSRIDRVVLRLNNTLAVRTISIQYLTGTAATSPSAPAITRSEDIYDLVLADIFISANATSVTVTDQRGNANLCGWVYSTSGDNSFFTSLDTAFNTWFESVKDTLSSVTLFKRYPWAVYLSSQTDTVQFNVPQYDPETCFYEVYVNGFFTNDYSQGSAANVIKFYAPLEAGTQVFVNVYKSIDGTGIESVADEITQLQNQVAAISGNSKYVYTCTGSNDNISLSQIAEAIYTAEIPSNITAAAQAFLDRLGGLAWLQYIEADAQITIEVEGHCDASTPYYGTGTSSNRYRYFSLGQLAHSDMRVIFDFAKCDTIYISPAANTSNIIFYGSDLYIKNASVFVSNASGGCHVQMIAGSNVGIIDVENCKFTIDTTGEAVIAANGYFENCECLCKSSLSNALCFKVTNNYLVRVVGGRYRAYVKNTTNFTAAIFYTSTGQGNAVSMAQNINCPTVAISNYYQQYLAATNSGKCIINGVISTMNSNGGSLNTIANQVWLSKEF